MSNSQLDADEKEDEFGDNIKSGGDTARNSPPSAPQENESQPPVVEHEFDTGLTAWLQVLGAFFLWFNSW